MSSVKSTNVYYNIVSINILHVRVWLSFRRSSNHGIGGSGSSGHMSQCPAAVDTLTYDRTVNPQLVARPAV